MREIETPRFGPLRIEESDVIRFPQALYGLEACHEYCLIAHDADSGFFWLQSLDEPTVALILTDPFRYFPDYQAEIPDAISEALETEDPADLTLFTTVSVSADKSEVSTNLLGPLAINREKGIGFQIVQHSSVYTCRHTLALRPLSKDHEVAG